MSTYPTEFSQLEKENKELKDDFETIETLYNALKAVNRHLEAENEQLKEALRKISEGHPDGNPMFLIELAQQALLE